MDFGLRNSLLANESCSGHVESAPTCSGCCCQTLTDCADYTVNMTCTSTEIRISFINNQLLDNFKSVLLHRYPALQWCKFRQRDCTSIQLDSGKTVTVHMWEGVRAVWLSGDGNQEWYNKECQEIMADAADGKVPPESFTVKRLDSGGVEVEFPSADYLPMIREQLVERYPTSKWREDSYKQQETTLKVARPGPLVQPSGRHRVKMPRCKLVVQLGGTASVVERRRLWLTDVKHESSSQQHVDSWIDTELRVICRSVHQLLQQQHICTSPTTSNI